MSTHTGRQRTAYNLAQQSFAGGGEGDIYEITNAVHLVAKKYKPKKATAVQEQKIIAMLNNPPPAQYIDQFAWPIDLLYENNRFAGYVMPRLQNTRALNEVYDYDDRKGKPWDFYVLTARNLAAVIHAAHKIGHVCGDLNPDNISVNPQGVITLIDTDTYHIYDKINNREFPGGVGRPEFVAPELQGLDLGSAPLPTFTRETDNFTLAVLIFSLLMNGSHPYSCSSTTGSLSKFQPIDNIARGLFPFVQTHAGLSIPNSAPPIDILTSELQELFKKAFIDGHANPQVRPQASDWYYALNNLNSSLKICAKDNTHFYYSRLSSCPWCKIEQKMTQVAVGQPKPNPPIGQSPYKGTGSKLTAPPKAPGAGNNPPTKPSRKSIDQRSYALKGLAILIIIAVATLFVNYNRTATIPLSDLEIGTRLVDPSWAWEYEVKYGNRYEMRYEEIIWIVVAKDHYGPGVTLLAEKCIRRNHSDFNRLVIDNSTDRNSTNPDRGSNHWGNSGTTDATFGLRPWLNSNGIHTNEGLYNAFSESFRDHLILTSLPNRNGVDGSKYVTQDKVFIPSSTELGDVEHADTYPIGEVYPFFVDNIGPGQIKHWTRSPAVGVGSNNDSESCIITYTANIISPGFRFGWDFACFSRNNSIRPAVNLKSDTPILNRPNREGVYSIHYTN